MPQILSLDLGSRHIGVAAVDQDVRVPVSRPTIHVTHDDQVLPALIELCQREQPTMLVVGLPLTLRGDTGPQAAHVESVVEQLRPRVACPIHLVDERMTNASMGPSDDDHSQAALAILQTYLETHS